jgi:CRP-like cAMP-binding protein
MHQTHQGLSSLELMVKSTRKSVSPPPKMKGTKLVRPPPADPRPKNKLLAGLPRADFERLKPHLRTVPTHVKQVFHPVNEPIRHVFFPNGGVASMTTVMKDGAMVEVATVGDEGLVGINALFGGGLAGGETMMQVPDTNAEMMSIEAFRNELDRGGAFFECIQRYSQGLLVLMMQSTACLALHPVHQRCCRWLLMTHDRVRRPEFHLSHEFLAMMLGSTRPTVTAVAVSLQKAGLIKYIHGRITIVDRKGLERASCECYATVKAHFDRLGL